MANFIVAILNLIIVPFKYHGLFVAAFSFILLSYLFYSFHLLMHK